MSDNHRLQDDLRACIHGFVVAAESNELTDEHWTHFERVLSDNEEACRLYAEYMDMSLSLASILDVESEEDSWLSDDCMPEMCFPEDREADVAVFSTLPSAAIRGTFGYLSSGWPAAYLIATVIFAIGAVVGSIIQVSHPVQIASYSDTVPSPLSPLLSPLFPGPARRNVRAGLRPVRNHLRNRGESDFAWAGHV